MTVASILMYEALGDLADLAFNKITNVTSAQLGRHCVLPVADLAFNRITTVTSAQLGRYCVVCTPCGRPGLQQDHHCHQCSAR